MELQLRNGLAGACACLPMVMMMLTSRDDPWQVLAVAANTAVRLLLPSSYCPASQTFPGILGHPVTARGLATIAELIFYYREAVALGLGFWGAPLGYLTIAGETLCWLHLAFQSELLGWIEDATWTLLQAVAFLTSNSSVRWVVAAPFVLYMLIVHLPRQLPRIRRPFFLRWSGSRLSQPDQDTFAWVVPSLLAKPITFALLIAAAPGEKILSTAATQNMWGFTIPSLVGALLLGLFVVSAPKGSNNHED